MFSSSYSTTFLAVFLILCLPHLTVLAKPPINTKAISDRLKEVHGNLTEIGIKLSEGMIEALTKPTDLNIILSMKSIHNFSQEYSDFLDYESTMVLMYPYLSESVKLYFSGILRDRLKQKRKEIGFQKSHSFILKVVLVR